MRSRSPPLLNESLIGSTLGTGDYRSCLKTYDYERCWPGSGKWKRSALPCYDVDPDKEAVLEGKSLNLKNLDYRHPQSATST